MRIDHPWALAGAAAVVAQILWLNAAPYALAEPWDTLWHFIAYASLTLLLWVATRGREPLLVASGVVVLGACTLDLAAAASAAAVTAGTLFFLQGKPLCAESSPR